MAREQLNVETLKDIVLFKDMHQNEIETALQKLEAHAQKYKKGRAVLHAGASTLEIGILLSGSITIESNDAWGNKTILSLVTAPGFFAETYALMPSEPLLVDVRANDDCKILFLRIDGLSKIKTSEDWATKFVKNLLAVSVQKNLLLARRALHTSPKTVRGRVMAYLNSVSLARQNRNFEIPFDRQQMADYLNVDRTALSKELSKMSAEGIIEFHKNRFKICATCE